MRQQLPNEISCGTDVEREIGISSVIADQFALGMMQWQGTQIIRSLIIGTNYDVFHWSIVGEHSKILGEVGLWTKTVRHIKGLVCKHSLCHAVESIDTHLVFLGSGQQIPALMEQLQGIGTDNLHIPFSAELLITYLEAAVSMYGMDNSAKVFLAGRDILSTTRSFTAALSANTP